MVSTALQYNLRATQRAGVSHGVGAQHNSCFRSGCLDTDRVVQQFGRRTCHVLKDAEGNFPVVHRISPSLTGAPPPGRGPRGLSNKGFERHW